MKQSPDQDLTQVLLEIAQLDSDGFGVSSHQGRTVRVKAALPGEAVTARILRKRKGEWLAEAKEVSSSHAARRRPPCGHFPRCGGCVLQHMDHAAQLQFKQQRLLDALQGQGVEPVQVNAPVSGPRLRYRRKARLGVKQLSQELLVGFRESFSSRVGRLQRCETLADPFGQQLPAYAALISGLSCAAQVPQLEVAAGDSAQQMIVRHLAPFTPHGSTAAAHVRAPGGATAVAATERAGKRSYPGRSTTTTIGVRLAAVWPVIGISRGSVYPSEPLDQRSACQRHRCLDPAIRRPSSDRFVFVALEISRCLWPGWGSM